MSGRRPGAPHHPLGCLEIPLDPAYGSPARIVLILLAIKIICAQERKGEGEGSEKLGYQSRRGQGEKGRWTTCTERLSRKEFFKQLYSNWAIQAKFYREHRGS